MMLYSRNLLQQIVSFPVERLEVLLELRETLQKSMQMEVILFLMRQKHRIVERGFRFRMDFSCIFQVIGVRMN